MQTLSGRLLVGIVVAFSATFAGAGEKKVTPDESSSKARSANDEKGSAKDATSATEAAGDEEIKPEALPKAIKSAIRKKFPKSKILSAEKGVEDGKPIYEASIQSDKHKIDVTLSPEGKILSYEKALSESERPKAMMESLNAKYPHATIKLVEEVWENGKFNGYEATILGPNKKSLDVSFDTKGRLVEDQKK
jgi:hypothetical protein